MTKAAPAHTRSVRTPTLFDKCFRFEDAERIRQAGVYSFFRVVDSAQDPEVVIGGRRMIMLGSNNYLGLTNDPRVKEAAVEAVRKYGTGCAGSRFLNGTLDLHDRLPGQPGGDFLPGRQRGQCLSGQAGPCLHHRWRPSFLWRRA